MKSLLLRLAPLCFTLLLAGCTEGTAECPETNATCSGQCTNLDIDRLNCGGCGIVCSGDFQCVEGGCACLPGETACGTSCADLENDVRNCGGCGNVCATGEQCIDGACDGSIACTGLECDVDGEILCIDPETDEANCGECGNECPEGVSCLGGTCTAGDLYAACFGEGTVVPLVKASNTPVSPKASGIDGPQSLAMLNDDLLLALGSIDQTLYVLDRATMAVVGSEVVGSAPNQIIVRDGRAYVIVSSENSVQVVDFADPADPETVDEVALGEGKSPSAGAFDDAGTLWVSAWLTGEVIPVDFSGARGVAETPVALDATGLEGTAYPSGVSVVDGRVYVAFNNLGADWAPAGNGRLATYDPANGEKGLIDLGASCTNATFTAVAGTDVYVACTGAYAADNGEVVVFDTATSEVTRRIPTAGAPSRISMDATRPGSFYVSDGAGPGFIAVDDQDAFTTVDVCPAVDFEFNSDVLVVP